MYSKFIVFYRFHRTQSCAFILMITTLLTLITHLAETSFHFHEKTSLEYLAIIFINSIIICIDIFKRFQIVIVDGIFNILMFQ